MSTNLKNDNHIAPKPPKTAVIGAGGFLGRKLLKAYRAFYPDTLGTHHQKGVGAHLYLDLAAPDIGAFKLVESGYTSVVIAAGIPQILRCEQEKEYTRARNVEGTLALARQISAAGLKLIWFSTDYVFDGITGAYPDDAPTAPLNEYGRQKAWVEKQLPEIYGDNYLIIRLCKVFDLDATHNTLLVQMARNLIIGETVLAAHDQVFCPTLIDDVVTAVLALQTSGASEIFNVCAPTPWSRYDLALLMADTLGVDKVQVKRISLDDLNEAFDRPKRTDLICRRLTAETGITFSSMTVCAQRLSKTLLRQIK
jgi:dTDP-4-dehydrorhamnose reductase